MSNNLKLVLFDADGTLVDSIAVIHECMRRTFVAHGLEEPREAQSRAIVGLTLDKAIATMLGQEIDEQIVAMANHYKKTYLEVARETGHESSLFPGIEAMIHRLAKIDNLLIGMVTGKARRGIDRFLDAHGFRPFFIVSRSADDCPSKPHPAMVLECCREAGMEAKDTVVVGDTSFDMLMAKTAGAHAYGVKWGYHAPEELENAGADRMVSSVAELEELLVAFAGNTALAN